MNLKYVGSVTLLLVAVACVTLGGCKEENNTNIIAPVIGNGSAVAINAEIPQAATPTRETEPTETKTLPETSEEESVVDATRKAVAESFGQKLGAWLWWGLGTAVMAVVTFWKKISKLWRREKKNQGTPPVQSQYLIPEKDVDLITWIQSVLRLEGFKLLAYVYDFPPRYAIGSSEKRKGFRVAFDAVYGKFYKVEGHCFFLNPSWYNGSDAHEIFLKYGLIELWVETKAGNFYALTPKCEELIRRIRSLQAKTEECKS